MTTPNAGTTPIPAGTPAQQRTFRRLRERYQHDHDVFSPREWNQLAFLRWLATGGRILRVQDNA